MKTVLRSKFFIGFFCFVLGLLTNHYYTKINFHSSELSHTQGNERLPVSPEDLDQDKISQAFQNMDTNLQAMHSALAKDMEGQMQITGVDRKEDDKNVIYEIPLNANEKNHELKVNVKDGMISIKEVTSNSESERQFSIDAQLDDTKADVQTLKDKIVIKIPKRI